MKRLPLILSATIVLFTLAVLSAQGMSATLKGMNLTGKVNINTANADELTLLPRVGVKMAARIIAYRSANGLFKSTDDLKKVKGIGEKVFTKMASLIKTKGKTDLRLNK